MDIYIYKINASNNKLSLAYNLKQGSADIILTELKS